MLRTAMAYLGAYICEGFGIDYKSKRVRMCDRDHLISDVSATTDKLSLPMVSYCIEGSGLYMGPRTRGTYVGASNTSYTEATTYKPIPLRTTIRIGIICRDEVQAFDAIESYYALSAAAQFEGVFHNGNDNIPFECGIFDLEDLTVPPGLKESRSYEERGSLYVLDGGFTMIVPMMYKITTESIKIIRATHLEYDLYDGNGNLVPAYSTIRESVGTFIVE